VTTFREGGGHPASEAIARSDKKRPRISCRERNGPDASSI
jgi:hypothetical protein